MMEKNNYINMMIIIIIIIIEIKFIITKFSFLLSSYI